MLIAATDGAARSTILSDSWASSSGQTVEARIMRMLVGSCWKNGSLRNEPSIELALSPSSCYVQCRT